MAPEASVVKEEKTEMARFDSAPQVGQDALSWDRLMGRSNSKRSWQVGQEYSYSGMVLGFSFLAALF